MDLDVQIGKMEQNEDVFKYCDSFKDMKILIPVKGEELKFKPNDLDFIDCKSQNMEFVCIKEENTDAVLLIDSELDPKEEYL